MYPLFGKAVVIRTYVSANKLDAIRTYTAVLACDWLKKLHVM